MRARHIGSGCAHSCSWPPVLGPAASGRAVERVQVQELHLPVLAALHRQRHPVDHTEVGRRGAAEVDVIGVEVVLICRGVVVEQLERRRELRHAVAPIRRTVERRIAGRHEDVPVRQHH